MYLKNKFGKNILPLKHCVPNDGMEMSTLAIFSLCLPQFLSRHFVPLVRS